MPTLVVYGKGDIARIKLVNLASDPKYKNRSSVKIFSPRFWQWLPRFEARFYNLTSEEIAAIKVKASLINNIRKIELI